jgi:hypothetical protein
MWVVFKVKLLVLVHCWCAMLSLFCTRHFYNMFGPYVVIIRKIRNCFTVLLFLVRWSKGMVVLYMGFIFCKPYIPYCVFTQHRGTQNINLKYNMTTPFIII